MAMNIHESAARELVNEITTIAAKAKVLHEAMEATLPAHTRVQEAHRQLTDAIRQAKSTAIAAVELFDEEAAAAEKGKAGPDSSMIA